MEITTLLNLVGWSIILIGLSIGWWMSNKEMTEIEQSTQFMNQSLKTGEIELIEQAREKLKSSWDKRTNVGGSYSIKMAAWLVAMGVFISNLIVLIVK